MKMPKLTGFEKIKRNIPFCRVFCGLSENYNMIEIRLPEQKLWPLENSNILL